MRGLDLIDRLTFGVIALCGVAALVVIFGPHLGYGACP